MVKADGLAAGKGVKICNNKSELDSFCKKIFSGKFKSSNKLVLEEFIKGEELSYFVIVDKKHLSFLDLRKIIRELVKKIQGQILVVWVLTRLPSFEQTY